MEAEFVTAALTIKEAEICNYTMEKLIFKDVFDSVHIYIDNTSALQVAGNRTYSPRVKHVALRCLFVQESRDGRGQHDYPSLRQDARPTR